MATTGHESSNKMIQAIRLSNRSVAIHQFTGQVANSSKNLETRVHGGGGGGYSYQGTGTTAPVTVSSTTVVHDQLFLVDKDGREVALQLQGWDLACREGNTVTAMWAVVEGDREGPYFAVVNHSTGSKVVKGDVVKGLARSCSAPFHFKIEKPVLGCLFLIALVALVAALFAIWWPLGAALVGYFIYFELVLLKRNIRLFNSTVQYPAVEPWSNLNR